MLAHVLVDVFSTNLQGMELIKQKGLQDTSKDLSNILFVWVFFHSSLQNEGNALVIELLCSFHDRTQVLVQ